MKERLTELIFSENSEDRVLGITMAYKTLGEDFLAEILPIEFEPRKSPLLGEDYWVYLEKGWIAMLTYVYEYTPYPEGLTKEEMSSRSVYGKIIIL